MRSRSSIARAVPGEVMAGAQSVRYSLVPSGARPRWLCSRSRPAVSDTAAASSRCASVVRGPLAGRGVLRAVICVQDRRHGRQSLAGFGPCAIPAGVARLPGCLGRGSGRRDVVHVPGQDDDEPGHAVAGSLNVLSPAARHGARTGVELAAGEVEEVAEYGASGHGPKQGSHLGGALAASWQAARSAGCPAALSRLQPASPPGHGTELLISSAPGPRTGHAPSLRCC